MEALREGAPEEVSGVFVATEQAEASPPSSAAMKNNSTLGQEDTEGRNKDVGLSCKPENLPVNEEDPKGLETCLSTISETPCNSTLFHMERAAQSDQTSTNLSAEMSIETRSMKGSDPENPVVSSFKPAGGNIIPTICPPLVPGDVVPKSGNTEADPIDAEALLLGLPADSLHSMASFLTPYEFCNFALCSQSSARICREILRRVRMHGFRCATEVVAAWSMNEHADAKELCALYISSGVPIYPHSLGHSYHTLVWRMSIEAQEMRASTQNDDPSASNQNSSDDNGGDVTSTVRRPVDRFFVERYETRAREGLNYEISYLEEKSLYFLNAERNANDASSFAQSVSRQISTTPNRLVLRPAQTHGHVLTEEAARAEVQGRPLFRLLSTGNTTPNNNDLLRRRATKSNSPSDARDRGHRVVVKVHRHLLDQHLLGRSCVDDKDGMMTTSPVNLSADFFHPHFRLRTPSSPQVSLLQKCATKFTSSDGFLSGEQLSDLHSQVVGPSPTMDMVSLRQELGELLVDPVAGIMQTRLRPVDVTYEYDSDEAQERHRGVNLPESIFEPTNEAVNESSANRRIPSAISQYAPSTHPNIFVNVDLDVYSASSANRKSDIEQQGYRGSRSHLRARFATYQLRLETLLAQHDSYGFDECMLDFWDEFLPQTASIHYYDRHTAVPRISSLQSFLTKPCPKAVGVVQCEIERIKIGSKKKGVNMKGRFFPTYEYRLFIRHRPVEGMDGVEPVRRDTVLMTAKNRGRKYFESSMPSGSTSKKGANNYYLYVPQQEDIEQHYKSVNGQGANTRSITNGASNFITPANSNNLMGRLQSNFIGTEFQIFTQKAEKKDQFTKSQCNPVNQLINPTCASEDDYGYDSGVSSDNPSSSARRRSRFGRLSLRRHGGAIPSEPAPLLDDHSRTKPLRRSRSSGDVNENARRTRTSRRAIANDSEGLDTQRQHLRQVEEEDGAITYTANLLGSRPRIMDVCIPKVSPDGIAGSEWRKYLEKCITDTDGGTGNRMLHHLKLIQQRMENEEHGLIRSTQGEDEARDTEEYSPPDDFGLLALQNRPPWWNIELGSFVLNFGGRVSVASVKNFQLCHRTDQDYIMLQFGRIQGRHSFTMDFQHPLTAVQAFAIAISSLQSKISFG